MRGKPYKQETGPSAPKLVSSTYVREALAKQAASRGAKKPPNLMPITPTLPRVPKPHKRRRSA
jgi:hypothetical protein